MKAFNLDLQLIFRKMTDNTICGCKGARFCALCKDSERVRSLQHLSELDFSSFQNYLGFCQPNSNKLLFASIPAQKFYQSDELDELRREQMQNSHQPDDEIKFEKLVLIENFLDEPTESSLVQIMDSQPWILSQSGRRKQDYGPKVNFKHQKVKMEHYAGMPDYA